MRIIWVDASRLRSGNDCRDSLRWGYFGSSLRVAIPVQDLASRKWLSAREYARFRGVRAHTGRNRLDDIRSSRLSSDQKTLRGERMRRISLIVILVVCCV